MHNSLASLVIFEAIPHIVACLLLDFCLPVVAAQVAFFLIVIADYHVASFQTFCWLTSVLSIYHVCLTLVEAMQCDDSPSNQSSVQRVRLHFRSLTLRSYVLAGTGMLL
jgi:hypothetical protein